MGKKKVVKAAPAKKPGECEFCTALVGQGGFCHGCKKYICDECEKSGGSLPFGVHDPEDHRKNPDLDGEEEESEGDEE